MARVGLWSTHLRPRKLWVRLSRILWVETLMIWCRSFIPRVTTGKPKGAAITTGTAVANAEMLTEAWNYRSDDVLLHSLLFHVHGLFVALNLALMNGGSVIMLPKFDPMRSSGRDAGFDSDDGCPDLYTRLLDQRFNRDGRSHAASSYQDRHLYLLRPLTASSSRTGQRILEHEGHD